MTRRKRKKQCDFWRGFIRKAKEATNEDQLKDLIRSLKVVDSMEIIHGWTSWCTVILDNGVAFISGKVFATDSLREICHDIYNYYVGDDLNYIKI